MSETKATELCAWCGKVVTHGDMTKQFTHGICLPCTQIYFPMEIAGIQAACDHDYEDGDIVHEEDEAPATFNPFSGSIGYRRVCWEVVHVTCKKCGHTDEVDRECEEHK